MNMATKKDIFEEHFEAWLKAKRDKKKRGEIVASIVFVTGLHRKSVPRRFRKMQLGDPSALKKPGRRILYGPDVTAALKDLFEAADEPCGELLHPVIAEYVMILRRDGMWQHNDEATTKLLAMSERTVKRRVDHFQKIRRGHGGMTSTSPSLLKKIIPIFKGPWNDLPPGIGQIDTVAHCGDSLSGSYVFTVNYTDVATYWVIPRAQWNKGQTATVESIEEIVKRSPFTITGLHPDSGGEFVNWHAKKWCDEQKIALTRSEPYKKNDNMFVEERNGHVVRRYLGYVRYDEETVVATINELYDVLGRYLNHFKAVKRMVSKERVGAKYVRRYEAPAKTPYQRVLEHPSISEEMKQRLRDEHARLNPLILKQKIDTLRKKIYEQQKRHETNNSQF